MDALKNYAIFGNGHDFLYPESGLDFHWWYNSPVGAHAHDYYEFLVVTKNKILHTLNGVAEEFPYGTFCFIAPNVAHSINSFKNLPTEHLNVSVSAETLKSICDCVSDGLYRDFIENKCFKFTLSQKDFESLYAKATEISSAPYKDAVRDKLLITQMVTDAVSIIYRKSSGTKENYPKWFEELLSQINAVDFEFTSVKNVYKLSNYSPATIVKYFKEYTGETIVSYMAKIKINRACALLQTTDFTIQTIADTLHYDSLSHFNRLFKKHVGQTPSEFRERFKKRAL